MEKDERKGGRGRRREGEKKGIGDRKVKKYMRIKTPLSPVSIFCH